MGLTGVTTELDHSYHFLVRSLNCLELRWALMTWLRTRLVTGGGFSTVCLIWSISSFVEVLAGLDDNVGRLVLWCDDDPFPGDDDPPASSLFLCIMDIIWCQIIDNEDNQFDYGCYEGGRVCRLVAVKMLLWLVSLDINKGKFIPDVDLYHGSTSWLEPVPDTDLTLWNTVRYPSLPWPLRIAFLHHGCIGEPNC